ncbi:MAG TPA: CdaR family protein [Candidatus Eisenbacteria bacterium]
MWARIRSILLDNLGLKLASLFLALLLYAHVVTDQPRESVVQIPVTLLGLPDSLAVTGKLPERVGVKVRGKWKDLIRLSLVSPYLPIDMGDARPGSFKTTITAEDVAERALPPELSKVVDVTEIYEPRSIDVEVEARATKRVRVVPRIVGNPPAGLHLAGPPEATPDSVLVQGAASVVAALDSIATLPVDITEERERIQRQVEIDPGSAPLTVEPRRCVVTARFEKDAPGTSPPRP